MPVLAHLKSPRRIPRTLRLQDELKTFEPKDYLEHLPSREVDFSGHPILETEWKRVCAQQPMENGLDTARYNIDPPPPERQNDPEAWEEAVKNAQTQLEQQARVSRLSHVPHPPMCHTLILEPMCRTHTLFDALLPTPRFFDAFFPPLLSTTISRQSLRLMNLQLMKQYGPNQWRLYLNGLEQLNADYSAELNTLNQKIEEINRKRKTEQEEAAPKLARMEAEWVAGVKKNMEIEAECTRLEAHNLMLRQKIDPTAQ